jgi:MFS family permease
MPTLNYPCDEGVVRSKGAEAPCSFTAGPWILAATIIGSAMAFIDGTVVNVALPEIQARLGATAVDAQWIVESYALFLAALILVGGSLGDHYGRKRIFALGIVLFAAASVWCGISRILIEGKGRAVGSPEARRAEGETAPA